VRDRDAIAEYVAAPAQVAWLRINFEIQVEESLIGVVAGHEHHPMFAEGDGLSVPIGRDMPDRIDRHPIPTLRAAYDMHLSAKLTAGTAD
jgi:hypothetical protein